jgi:hypothetical protein
LAFKVSAAGHSGVARSGSAAASVPVRFGMRLSGPGNRATRAARIAGQASYRNGGLRGEHQAAATITVVTGCGTGHDSILPQ